MGKGRQLGFWWAGEGSRREQRGRRQQRKEQGCKGLHKGGGGAGAPWYAHITDPAFASTIADLNGGR